MAALTRALTIQSGTTRRIQQAQVLDVAAGIVASNDAGSAQDLSIEAAVGGSINIGTTAATGTINIGQAGATVNFPGLVNFTSTTAAPNVVFQGDVTIGDASSDRLYINSEVGTDLVFANGAQRVIRIVGSAGAGDILSIAAGYGGTSGGLLAMSGGDGAAGASGGFMIGGGEATGGNGGNGTIWSGSSTTGASGNMTVDAGDYVTTGGILYLGTTYASAVNIGNSGATTSITGSANSVTGDTTFADDIFFAAGVAHVIQVNSGAGTGGTLSIAAGGSTTAAGGALSIAAGSSAVGAGADVTMRGGQGGNNAAGGDVHLKGGLAGAGVSTYGNVYLGEDQTSNVYIGSATGAGVWINYGAPGNPQKFNICSSTLSFMGGATPHEIMIVDQAIADANGTKLSVVAGKGNGHGDGGELRLIGGAGVNGGSTILLGGDALAAGAGGASAVKGGDSPSGAGGDVFLAGGEGGASNGVVRIGQASTSAINLYANTVVQSGATLSAAAGGMIDLPQNFEIAGAATAFSNPGTGQVTAPNLNTLTAGPTSNADALHTHSALSAAVTVSGTTGEVIDFAGMVLAWYDRGTGPLVFKSNATSGSNYRNAVGLAYAAYGSGVTGQAIVAGPATVSIANVFDGPLSADDVGKPCWISKTAGKLTRNVSGYTAGDVVQKVGIITSVGGGNASIAVQVGDAVTL
jgi:hypothetical protein